MSNERGIRPKKEEEKRKAKGPVTRSERGERREVRVEDQCEGDGPKWDWLDELV